ncbi:DUF4254 domain-containing protein [Sanguibacteroides justesenii]|uniref:DUF4254 domain-containing protein n=1 Tax=Sanguibacteroides justesenii TaxID=1547597 RepID=A0AB34R662_9PORP|nr:DUF4254 domain-containing protein [Sanguibacteroides justesenii]KIO43143.1 hypothetical protein IE90_13105 [Sanguibacteroides justesenii]
MSFTEWSYRIFDDATHAYHLVGEVEAKVVNPYDEKNIAYHLYVKNWTDAIQWHLEDIIRDPDIVPEEALRIKRRIDVLNQIRTDIVEKIDDWFLAKYKDVKTGPDAVLNTESPAWALDRLSILALKIYHMEQEVERRDVSSVHVERCRFKLDVLKCQRQDLIVAIDQLLADIESGRKYMKVYRQMKMYNDPMLNPVLYKKMEVDD